jgi:hypothetical protein
MTGEHFLHLDDLAGSGAHIANRQDASIDEPILLVVVEIRPRPINIESEHGDGAASERWVVAVDHAGNDVGRG